MNDRYEPLRRVAREASLDAIALVPGANFTRLLGADFHQNERPLIVLVPAEGAPAAVVPNLELASFSAIGFEGQVFDWRDQSGYESAFVQLLSACPVTRIGVEGQLMRVFISQALTAASSALQSSVQIVDAQKPIASLRLNKTPDEVNGLEAAIALSELSLSETIESVRIGMTEAQIESVLIQRLFANGAQEFAFSPIVAAGDNSAKPHASARADYAIKAGDALLIDFGGRLNGFCADITRTFFIGHCDDRKASIYETVLAANMAGHAASKPGATAHDVDDATTAVLEASEHADRIRHKTGHGLGRDIHEDPYIMRGNLEVLSAGMVYTIEPGLYEDDDFGVRIEDDVLITDSGSRSLTTFDKSLTVLC